LILDDPALEDLLRAATAEGAACRSSFFRWIAGRTLDDATAAEHALLPLLARNLERHGVDHPVLPRLRGVYRYHWTRNRLLLERARTALDELRALGTEVLIAGRAAVLLGCYPDPGCRPLDVVDVVTAPPKDARRRRSTVEIAGLRADAVPAEESLIDACVSDAGAPEEGLLRLADVIAIAGTRALAWGEVARAARLRRATGPVRRTLGDLAARSLAPVPRGALGALVDPEPLPLPNLGRRAAAGAAAIEAWSRRHGLDRRLPRPLRRLGWLSLRGIRRLAARLGGG
jgi:hypothetical protein